MRSACIAVLCVVALRAAIAGDPVDTAHAGGFSPLRFSIVAVPTVGGFIVGHVWLNSVWWKGSRVPFHFNFQQDWDHSLGADKFGHFYFPYIVTDAYARMFEWSGIDSTSALYYAAGLGMLYQTYIEIRDGFSRDYGFSVADLAADVLGAGWGIAQRQWQPLRSVNWKISFFPSSQFRSGYYNAIIDDYESTFHWMTINVHDLLPEGYSGRYPRLINLAVGHGVTNLVPDPSRGRHEFFLALDWNLEALPGDAPWWNTIKHFLNYYHLPAPAVRVYPDVAWFALRW